MSSMNGQRTLDFHFHGNTVGSLELAVLRGGSAVFSPSESAADAANTQGEQSGETLPLPLFSESGESLERAKPHPSTNIRMQQSRPEGSPTRIEQKQIEQKQIEQKQIKQKQIEREQIKQKRSNQKPTQQSRQLSSDVDQHMQAAWQIAKALKTGKWRSTKLKAVRAKADLFQASDAKRQFGIAICEHLRASLQQQMAWEQQFQQQSQQQQSASQQPAQQPLQQPVQQPVQQER